MASEQIVNSTDTSFDTDVLKSNVPVLVDFWAEWCGPCLALAPTIDELAKEYAGRLKVVKVNVSDNPNAPGKYRVQGIPTLVFFKDGKMVDQIVGKHPKNTINDVIVKVLA